MLQRWAIYEQYNFLIGQFDLNTVYEFIFEAESWPYLRDANVGADKVVNKLFFTDKYMSMAVWTAPRAPVENPIVEDSGENQRRHCLWHHQSRN